MEMRKVIGISETVFDILFKEERPVAGVPGGSVLNGMVTLGRTGIPCIIMTETGSDHIGGVISRFLTENGVSDEYVIRGEGKKSSVSLAFLDENNDAHYTFYKDYDSCRFQFRIPEVNTGDIVMIGSYFALIPSLRPQVREFLEYARGKGAVIYYDINFRPNHSHEKEQLMESVHENCRFADIVRGSADDFEILFGHSDTGRLWQEEISPYCSSFICTRGADGTDLRTRSVNVHFPSKDIRTVSTIGAGDSFNAGIIYGLFKEGISKEDISQLNPTGWNRLISYGIDFSSDVCCSTENYISKELASRYHI